LEALPCKTESGHVKRSKAPRRSSHKKAASVTQALPRQVLALFYQPYDLVTKLSSAVPWQLMH
jgi:hypothetical protein